MNEEELRLNGIWVGFVQVVNVYSIGRKRHISFVVVTIVKNVIKKNTKGISNMTQFDIILLLLQTHPNVEILERVDETNLDYGFIEFAIKPQYRIYSFRFEYGDVIDFDVR